jgi:malonyl CoA-acyl carrier protein transacylase
MFPGQPLFGGAQTLDDPDYRDIAALTAEKTHFDLGRFCWLRGEGSENVKLQIYGGAMSLYEARRLRRDGVTPGIIAEHSMGIYSALAACGSLSEGEALELTWRVGCCMAKMSAAGRYALGCIVGLTLEPLLAVAESNEVYLANHNTSRHFLLCGERHNIERATAEALQRGAFSAKTFPCDAPLHTPLMEDVADELRDIFTGYRYREPTITLLNHIDQDCLTASELAAFMERELTLPVFWERTYHALRATGVTAFFEVGAGDALKKYNRWIESENR